MLAHTAILTGTDILAYSDAHDGSYGPRLLRTAPARPRQARPGIDARRDHGRAGHDRRERRAPDARERLPQLGRHDPVGLHRLPPGPRDRDSRERLGRRALWREDDVDGLDRPFHHGLGAVG